MFLLSLLNNLINPSFKKNLFLNLNGSAYKSDCGKCGKWNIFIHGTLSTTTQYNECSFRTKSAY